jgi:hypothetical protein
MSGKDTIKTPLAKGQVWRTPVAEFEILALGKRLIQYKVTKQAGERWVSAQISPVEAMARYLMVNDARLA